MLDRKLLVDALRINNQDVIPKFESYSFKSFMEEHQEKITLDSLLDPETFAISEDGIYTIMDALTRGVVTIVDDEDQPALTLTLFGSDIQVHNLFTDEDVTIDHTPEAIKDYISDQLDQAEVMEAEDELENPPVETDNVIFKVEEVDYLNKQDILAVFPDREEHVEGDQLRVVVYSYIDHEERFEDPIYLENLPDATDLQYADLAQELRDKGYNLNILNGLQEPSSDSVDPYEGTYHEESPLEVPAGYALDEEGLQNYAVVLAQDIGNDIKILNIKEGYHSFEEAQVVINDMETEEEFEDDPTLMLFVAYSDGTTWYNAVTGDELELSGEESREVNDVVDDLYDDDVNESVSKYKVGDKVKVVDSESMAYWHIGTIHSIRDDVYMVLLKDSDDEDTLMPFTDDELVKLDPTHESLEVKQYNKPDKDDHKDKITEYSCNTMAEVRKIFKNSSELNKIDKVEVHQDGKLLYVGTPVAPSKDNKRWSFSWKKESLDDEAAVIIDEIYRKIVVAADSIKRSLTTKANFMDPDRALNALDELNSLVDQDIEDLINSVDQRLD